MHEHRLQMRYRTDQFNSNRCRVTLARRPEGGVARDLRNGPIRLWRINWWVRSPSGEPQAVCQKSACTRRIADRTASSKPPPCWIASDSRIDHRTDAPLSIQAVLGVRGVYKPACSDEFGERKRSQLVVSGSSRFNELDSILSISLTSRRTQRRLSMPLQLSRPPPILSPRVASDQFRNV